MRRARFLAGFLLLTALFFIAFFHTASAAFNQQINYQGKLTNASNVAVADGTYHMRFALYTVASAGSSIWSEDRSTATGDRITVTNGLFSVMIFLCVIIYIVSVNTC